MSQPPNPPYGLPYGQPYGQQNPGSGSYYVNFGAGDQGPMDVGQLAHLAGTGQVKGETMIHTGNQQWFPAKHVPGLFSQKEWLTTVLLSWLLGGLAIDRFYLGYTGLGIAKLLTCGGCGVWSLIDAILVTLRKVPDVDGRPLA